MNKVLKTVLCILLATTIVLSFVSCVTVNKKSESKNGEVTEKHEIDATEENLESKNSKNGEAKEENPKEETPKKEENPKEEFARISADGFMEGFIKFDSDLMGQYALSPKDTIGIFGFKNLGSKVKGIAYRKMTEDEKATMSSVLDPVIDTYVEETLKTISCEFLKVNSNKKDGSLSFYYEVTSPNFEAIANVLDEVASKENMDRIAEEAANELAENNRITKESTEEEIMQAVVELVSSKMSGSVAKQISSVKSEVKDKVILVLVEEDGKWLVDTKKSKKLSKVFDIESMFKEF